LPETKSGRIVKLVAYFLLVHYCLQLYLRTLIFIWIVGRGLLFKVLAQYSPVGTEKNTKNLSQDSWCLDRDLNRGPPEYEAGVLTTPPRRSMQ
jgi:hypothetical protein